MGRLAEEAAGGHSGAVKDADPKKHVLYQSTVSSDLWDPH